ncbi:MAG: BamA/TamA family outer membrane protein [Weeksellaceae bacterium]|nr:BamA/TamA family outer membrane protein [Weeksellaceae bacterium]
MSVRATENLAYQPSDTLLQADLGAYMDDLVSRGFYTAHIDRFQSDSLDCRVYVTMGSQYTSVNTLTVIYPDSTERKHKFENAAQMHMYVDFLKDSLIEAGQPFAPLAFSNPALQDSSVTLQLGQSSFRKIDRIRIVGYDKFPKRLYKQLTQRQSTPTRKNIDALVAQIESTGAIQSVDEPKIAYIQDSTHLYLYLQKRKRNFAKGILGFGTDDQGRLKFTGDIEIALRNAFNTLEDFHLHWQNGVTGNQQFRFGADIYSFFRSPVGGELNLEMTKLDSLSFRFQSFAGLNFNYLQHRLGARLLFSSGNQVGTDVLAAQNFRKNGFGLSYIFSYRIPTALNQPYLQLAVITDRWTRISGDARDIQYEIAYNFEGQTRIFQNHFVYHKIFGRNLLSEAPILPNEFYMIGGNNSIRGFLQNSIYTGSYNLINAAYRFIPTPQIGLEVFTDIGLLRNELQSYRWLSGVGVGLQLQTRPGLLQVSYAVGKYEDQPWKFADGKINVGLVNQF